MVDKGHLRDKQVVFRLTGGLSVYSGTVKNVEADGFWIDSPSMVEQLRVEDQAWEPMVKKLAQPMVFIPMSSLIFLIAGND